MSLTIKPKNVVRSHLLSLHMRDILRVQVALQPCIDGMPDQTPIRAAHPCSTTYSRMIRSTLVEDLPMAFCVKRPFSVCRIAFKVTIADKFCVELNRNSRLFASIQALSHFIHCLALRKLQHCSVIGVCTYLRGSVNSQTTVDLPRGTVQLLQQRLEAYAPPATSCLHNLDPRAPVKSNVPRLTTCCLWASDFAYHDTCREDHSTVPTEPHLRIFPRWQTDQVVCPLLT